MKQRVLAFLSVLLFSQSAHAVLQCVTYVQQHGYPDFVGAGSAYEWWGKALGKSHGRGSEPLIGAVLVWKPWGSNSAGHVALVASINIGGDSRKIAVNHANWPSGTQQNGIVVEDVSANNDWTSVKKSPENTAHDTYGFIYPVCKQGDNTCILRRNGEVAWYPAINKCSNASQWFYVEAEDPIIFKIGPASAILCDMQSQSCPAN